MARHYLFTSESVTEGHPDKVCDQISDAVLDAILEQDPNGRVACETTACTGLIHVMGEITTSCYVDIAHIAREVVRDIGYDRGKYGFDCDTCAVVTSIDEQSADIAMGVDKSLENKEGTDSELSNGAGDQGMMFGYACDETPELMPLPLSLAQKLCKRMAEVRKSGQVPYMRPDGKSQVTVEYDEHNRPVRVDTVVISTQHDPDVSLEQIRKDMIEQVAKAVIPADMLDENTKYYVNPTGRFVKGGPAADSGLTGRKIIVDTYGGSAPHGGGCFSGKDPTKVDRSAAYAARYVAKNIVAYREENGAFTDRRQLKKVPKLGPKAYLNAAGFLRISGGKNPLDATSVHPESYEVATSVLERAGVKASELSRGGVPDIERRLGSISALASDLDCGTLTLIDIVNELKKPGRDPRDDAPEVVFSRSALSIDDLEPGMELKGTVRNVVDFGAFVDVGVHQDGLVHISKLANRFVKHPSDVVRVGDTVKVWVEKVDRDRKKISLTMVQGK